MRFTEKLAKQSALPQRGVAPVSMRPGGAGECKSLWIECFWHRDTKIEEQEHELQNLSSAVAAKDLP